MQDKFAFQQDLFTHILLHKKGRSPRRISLVNLIKSACHCGSGRIYQKKSLTENFIFCSVLENPKSKYLLDKIHGSQQL